MTAPRYRVRIDSTLGRRLADVRRGRRARSARRRDPRVRPRLPSVPVRRQPQRHRRVRRRSPGGCSTARRRGTRSGSSTRPARSGRSRGWPATASAAARIRHGLTLTCLGDTHPFTYKRTVGGERPIDRAAAHVLAADSPANQVDRLLPVRLRRAAVQLAGVPAPVGSLMRGRHGLFPEYHTSGDDLSFVSGARMAHSLDVLAAIVDVVDEDRRLTTSSRSASRSSAGAACTARSAVEPPGRSAGDAVGAQPVRRRTRCWTSPNGPGCRSRQCVRRPRCSSSTASSLSRTPSTLDKRPICVSVRRHRRHTELIAIRTESIHHLRGPPHPATNPHAPTARARWTDSPCADITTPTKRCPASKPKIVRAATQRMRPDSAMRIQRLDADPRPQCAEDGPAAGSPKRRPQAVGPVR